MKRKRQSPRKDSDVEQTFLRRGITEDQGGRMDMLNFGKGKITLTFYDMSTGSVIADPIQIEVRREYKLIGTFLTKNGMFVMNDLPRTEMGFVGYMVSEYYSYDFEITSVRYKKKSIQCEFDRHTKNMTLDIALDPKNVEYDTKIYR